VIFITATDTGVGKTLVTGLLLHHLRNRGIHALAMKPFCCGGLGDIELLWKLQRGELSRDEISPFYYDQPVAPLVAARRHRRSTSLAETLEVVRRTQSKCECLLVEGIGGLLVPLGERFVVRDLVVAMDCHVLVVARNQIGTINHTLLTLNSLREKGVRRIKILLSGVEAGDASSRTNPRVLAELVAPTPLISLPFLGRQASTIGAIKKNCKFFKKTLARVLGFDTFSLPFGKSVGVEVKAVSENSR